MVEKTQGHGKARRTGPKTLVQGTNCLEKNDRISIPHFLGKKVLGTNTKKTNPALNNYAKTRKKESIVNGG